ncbi:type 2 lanthipeptide synthetase LanM family protein [Halosolutus gelatinilyticus]|uniref:type 2 lanthipeptide synthetase LanM family protein n=1 Tax=Halosolutus gelatinilyticus TaxID=2931975 RepID=UPI001FF45A26|nr:type 2 lanthipeptide synthetase LanM family protein [Halosolutus gelatinilyticus]
MTSVFTDEQRREIVGRARTLFERIEGPTNVRGDAPPIDPDQIVDAWNARFPDDEAFRNRLSRDGLSEELVREHAAATRFPADEPLPDWIDALEALIGYVEAWSPEEQSAVRVDDLPFVDLLVPIAEFARERVPEAAVSGDALDPMVEWLLRRLERLCVRPLYVEFKSRVARRDPDRARAEPDAYADPPTTYYERFVESAFDGGFADLCLEYPVLARHLVRLVWDWTDAVLEVSRRIRADRRILRDRFGAVGAVESLRPLGRETHSNGRIPIRVSFSGSDVVYKPRPVDAGIAFYEILDRLDEHLSIPSFDSPTYVPRDGYGWMEAIEYRDPADDAAVERYYERAGALVCLGYVLEFIDVQFENVIAAGEHPTIVDAETVFHPYVEPTGKNIRTGIGRTLDESVFLTALVPVDAGVPDDFDGVDFRTATGAGSGRDSDRHGQLSPREQKARVLAGLGSRSGATRLSVRTRPVIEAVNTDVMSVTFEPVTRDATTNTPTVDGDDEPPADHLNAFVRGFDETYRTIATLHADGRFRSEIAPAELIAGVENRLVYRPTHRYTAALRRMGGRESLRDGVRTTVEMEGLAVPFFDGSIETDEYWPLYAAERAELRRLDVPRFTSCIDRRAVEHRGTDLGVAADESGYERCRRRLETMSDDDRRRQIGILRECYGDSGTETDPPPTAVDATDDRLRTAAVEAFDDVLESAVETPAGPAWTFVDPTRAGTTRLVLSDDSLYCGTAGIALTAAALYRATGRRRYRQLVTEIFEPSLDRPSPPRGPVDLGGPRGIGSTIYGLSAVADLLDEDRFRRAAIDAAGSVSEDRLGADGTAGVMAGYAGTLLALLACYERFGDATVLERALLCGDRLLERVTDGSNRVRGPAGGTRRTAGFARGSAGIAYALVRLAAVAGEPRYAEPVRDVRATDPATSASVVAPQSRHADWDGEGWCCGRSGIALSWIGVAERLGAPRYLEAATAALGATARSERSPLDNLYCGNFGRVEALLVGSNRGRCDGDVATEFLGRCLPRRERAGSFSLTGHSRSAVNPSFFGGISGVSYTLLRVLYPDTLPCVLLLE